MEENQPKISLPEGIIMVMITLLADIFEFLIDLTLVGIIVGEIINFIIGGILQLWLFLRGIKGFWKLGTNVIGTLADGLTASFLPIKTVTLIITIIMVNNPKTAKVAQVAGKVSSLKSAAK